MKRTSNAACLTCTKGFYSDESKNHSMRAADAKTLNELEILYEDKNCFYPLREWFGTAEIQRANIECLFMVADYAKKHSPSVAEKITAYSRGIEDLFRQTKDYVRGWGSKHKEKHSLSSEDYVEATNESWGELDNWSASQEKLRCLILEFVEFLHSIVSRL